LRLTRRGGHLLYLQNLHTGWNSIAKILHHRRPGLKLIKDTGKRLSLILNLFRFSFNGIDLLLLILQLTQLGI
jgi:hypothetical protein